MATVYEAARGGDVALLQSMLQAGASVDDHGPGGRKQLAAHLQRQAALVEACRLLLAYNANPDTADGGTLQTPLHIASEANFARRNNGSVEGGGGLHTPLHIASEVSLSLSL
ncbi:hypothetical protein T484DRAFT_1787667 [Baffinella frigidus]|nr:hypothetical protein T484DRAFT_1787667 [Cryptophyta sp. CCMP2293]